MKQAILPLTVLVVELFSIICPSEAARLRGVEMQGWQPPTKNEDSKYPSDRFRSLYINNESTIYSTSAELLNDKPIDISIPAVHNSENGNTMTQESEIPNIINGIAASLNEFPSFTMILDYTNGEYYNSGCGGTLVHQKYVLTAAHCCVWERRTMNDFCYIGANSPWHGNAGQIKAVIEVDEVILHPEYDPTTKSHDVAILKLKQTVGDTLASTYGEWARHMIKPMRLSDWNYFVENILSKTEQTLTVAGFGRTEKGYSSQVLMKADVNYVPRDQCNENYNGQITESMICASENGVRDACQGDSGGPLFVRDTKAQEYVQVAIVSWGSGCAQRDFPGVYADVPSHLDWIRSECCSSSSNGETGLNDDYDVLCATGSTVASTGEPTQAPSSAPTTEKPTASPMTSTPPSQSPTSHPSANPTTSVSPSFAPTTVPPLLPTTTPTQVPTQVDEAKGQSVTNCEDAKEFHMEDVKNTGKLKKYKCKDVKKKRELCEYSVAQEACPSLCEEACTRRE